MKVIKCDKCKKEIKGVNIVIGKSNVFNKNFEIDLCDHCYNEIKSYIEERTKKL